MREPSDKAMPTAEVLLSAYNGEKYIADQIESIMFQNGVKIHATVRDDGSTDHTPIVLQELKNRFGSRLTVVEEGNIGYRKSFLSLLSMAEKADYYCFSDQDDYWEKDKLVRAITCLQKFDASVPSLYASSLDITDDDLKKSGFHDISKRPNTIESFYTRSGLAGCTFVFNQKLMDIVSRFSNLDMPEETMPDHDTVVASCSFACGNVYLDPASFILHRRHDKSITNGGTGIKKRLRSEYAILFKRKNVRSSLAKEMLRRINKTEIRAEAWAFLEEIAHYQENSAALYRLLKNKKMKSGTRICDIETKLKILLRNY